jgi:hypothetical protein
LSAIAAPRRFASRLDSRIQSLPIIVLLHLVVLALAAYVAMRPFPLPADEWKIDRATFHFDDQTESAVKDVALPDNWTARDKTRSSGRYEFIVSQANKGFGDDPAALFIPRFTWRATVYFNGHRVYSSASNPASETIARNTSIFVTLPAVYWIDGGNRLEVIIEQRAVVTGYLSEIYLGPQSALGDAFSMTTTAPP